MTPTGAQTPDKFVKNNSVLAPHAKGTPSFNLRGLDRMIDVGGGSAIKKEHDIGLEPECAPNNRVMSPRPVTGFMACVQPRRRWSQFTWTQFTRRP